MGLASPLVRGGSFFKVRISLVGQELGEAFSAILIRNIALHEIGHAFGLGHFDTAGDLMSPSLPANADAVVIGISSCDKDGFDTAHDWYPTGPFSAPAEASIDC